ncbi:MAG: glycosyltransferase family 2 protein [Phycisphaerales bacterium]|nr:glycosyltransferase family 2 protein [Phycisphaerales bacterium]
MLHPVTPKCRYLRVPSPLPVSIVILTLNEQGSLPGCLRSCSVSDDVHVLDSGSTDQTCSIARDHGKQVWTNPFRSFGAQRNWAIDNIPTRYDWQLQLDADEELTPALIREIASVIVSNPQHAGYFIPNKLMFLGQWLRRSSGYPVYQMRLFHKQRMRYQDHGHGQRELTEGTLGKLREPYLHFAFAKGLDDWFAKHNRYSTQEVEQYLCQSAESDWSGLFSQDRLRRRRAIKAAAFRLPCRSLLRSLWVLIGQGGLLDGRAGWNYVRMMHCYESMIDLKLKAARHAASASSVRP